MSPHPLDLPARAAYGAFAQTLTPPGEAFPPWEALPAEAHEDWRAVADAVLMVAAPPRVVTPLRVCSDAEAEELERQWVAKYGSGAARAIPLAEVMAPEAIEADPGHGWYCLCPDAGGPHVHCPWGGGHIHRVDPETGRDVESA